MACKCCTLWHQMEATPGRCHLLTCQSCHWSQWPLLSCGIQHIGVQSWHLNIYYVNYVDQWQLFPVFGFTQRLVCCRGGCRRLWKRSKRKMETRNDKWQSSGRNSRSSAKHAVSLNFVWSNSSRRNAKVPAVAWFGPYGPPLYMVEICLKYTYISLEPTHKADGFFWSVSTACCTRSGG